jgi:hypothetical protein
MTNFFVTLKALRKAEACVSGYNKVVCSLSGKEFNPKRKTYIRYKHEGQISILSIIESNGIYDALWATRCVTGNDRDLRLFAVWCARQVLRLMTDKRSINAIDTAERYANGKATDAELAAAWAATRDAARAAAGVAARDASWAAAGVAARDASWAAAWAAARAAAWAAARDAAWAAAGAAARDAAWAAAGAAARDAAWDAQREMFVRMLNGTAPWQVGGKK